MTDDLIPVTCSRSGLQLALLMDQCEDDDQRFAISFSDGEPVAVLLSYETYRMMRERLAAT